MTLCCVHEVWLPQLSGDYLWLPLVTSVTRYCMTLCCVRGVWLPQLPGGYLWLPVVTFGYQHYQTLCCVCGVRLPQLPGGYTCGYIRYCMTLCCTWSMVTSVTSGYIWATLLPQQLPVFSKCYHHYCTVDNSAA